MTFQHITEYSRGARGLQYRSPPLLVWFLAVCVNGHGRGFSSRGLGTFIWLCLSTLPLIYEAQVRLITMHFLCLSHPGKYSRWNRSFYVFNPFPPLNIHDCKHKAVKWRLFEYHLKITAHHTLDNMRLGETPSWTDSAVTGQSRYS